MFLTVRCGILILGKIARGMLCIIKSNYLISCNSFLINREKIGDYLKWTDYINILCLKTAIKLTRLFNWQIYSSDQLLHRMKSKSYKHRYFTSYHNTKPKSVFSRKYRILYFKESIPLYICRVGNGEILS